MEQLQDPNPEQWFDDKHMAHIRENGEQVGLFLGIQHTHERDSLTTRLIINGWRGFLERSKDNLEECVVILEGGERTPIPCSLDDPEKLAYIADNYGEQVLVASLAAASGVEIISGDSLVMEEMTRAAEDEPELAEYIPLYILMRYAPQWMREFDNGTRTEEEVYMQAITSMQEKCEILTGQPNSLFTVEQFEWPALMEAYEELYGKKFDFVRDFAGEKAEESMGFQTSHYVDETKERQLELAEEYPMIKLTMAVSTNRDEIIWENIEERWNNNDSIFSAFGLAHFVDLRKKLSTLGRPFRGGDTE